MIVKHKTTRTEQRAKKNAITFYKIANCAPMQWQESEHFFSLPLQMFHVLLKITTHNPTTLYDRKVCTNNNNNYQIQYTSSHPTVNWSSQLFRSCISLVCCLITYAAIDSPIWLKATLDNHNFVYTTSTFCKCIQIFSLLLSIFFPPCIYLLLSAQLYSPARTWTSRDIIRPTEFDATHR